MGLRRHPRRRGLLDDEINGLIAGDNTKTVLTTAKRNTWPARRLPRQSFCSARTATSITSRASSTTSPTSAPTASTVAASYTLDSKKRGLGDFGTFVLGVTGTFINSYLINSPRALREYYRDTAPVYKADGTRDYSNVHAQYEAAGYRNLDNFAPPIPQPALCRAAALAVRGPRGRRHDALYRRLQRRQRRDDSNADGLPGINNLAIAEGESIPAWTVFDPTTALPSTTMAGSSGSWSA